MERRPPSTPSPPLLSTPAALVLAIGGLAVYGVLRATIVPDRAHLVANVGAAGMLAVLAGAARLTAEELGLSRRAARAGSRYGVLAVLVVSVVVAIGVVLPWTEAAFDDERLDVGARGMAYQVLVRIPLGTVLLEELAFRGVLLALLRRLTGTPAAIAWSSMLFGLWHVPSLVAEEEAGPALVGGTIVATTAAGVVFAALRVRSGSLVASALAHLGTNSVTFTLAWWAR